MSIWHALSNIKMDKYHGKLIGWFEEIIIYQGICMWVLKFYFHESTNYRFVKFLFECMCSIVHSDPFISSSIQLSWELIISHILNFNRKINIWLNDNIEKLQYHMRNSTQKTHTNIVLFFFSENKIIAAMVRTITHNSNASTLWYGQYETYVKRTIQQNYITE